MTQPREDRKMGQTRFDYLEEQQEDEAGRFLTETAMSLDMSKLNRAETSRALGGGSPA